MNPGVPVKDTTRDVYKGHSNSHSHSFPDSLRHSTFDWFTGRYREATSLESPTPRVHELQACCEDHVLLMNNKLGRFFGQEVSSSFLLFLVFYRKPATC